MGFEISWVSILHSIMLNFDWVYDMLFVYRGKTKHLWTQALTNGSDSEDMEVRDGLLFGLGSRIYDLS